MTRRHPSGFRISDFRTDTDGKATRWPKRGRKVARTIVDGVVGRRFRGRKADFLPFATFVCETCSGRNPEGESANTLLILFACNPSTSHPRCRVTKSSGEGIFVKTPAVSHAGAGYRGGYKCASLSISCPTSHRHVATGARCQTRGRVNVKREEDRVWASPHGL